MSTKLENQLLQELELMCYRIARELLAEYGPALPTTSLSVVKSWAGILVAFIKHDRESHSRQLWLELLEKLRTAERTWPTEISTGLKQEPDFKALAYCAVQVTLQRVFALLPPEIAADDIEEGA